MVKLDTDSAKYCSLLIHKYHFPVVGNACLCGTLPNNKSPSFMQPVRSNRIQSIDLLRGIVMIIMPLDHTRDFFHFSTLTNNPLDPATTTLALYLTRWITHFCAPVFVLLSGVSAYLSSRNKTPGEAGAFLIKRGLWLVFIEIVIITLGFSFNLHYNIINLQVIWAIGTSMIILGLLRRLPYKAILIIGLVLFFGHDLVWYATLPQNGPASYAWKLFLTTQRSIIPLSANHVITDNYAILPWTGVMLVGYGMGRWFDKEYTSPKRRRRLLLSGYFLIVFFFVLRALNGYGDPAPWRHWDTPLQTFFSFFSVSKYPPSLMYLSATLGIALIALCVLEGAKGKWVQVVSVFGRVPFFFYILHFYLLHALLVVVFFATGHTASEITTPHVIYAFRPVHFGYGLIVIYIIWIIAVVALYFPCRWYNRYKMEHRQWWLSYI